jgi:hypothetical protein
MVKPSGSGVAYSSDNGRTWSDQPANPDFEGKLPHGYRRESFPFFVDPVNGRVVKVINSLDTPGLDPSIIEPPIALNAYYLRYRVSVDGGKTFLFDEPIVQQGKTPENPFDGVVKGKNGIFMGDVGSQLIRTQGGRILIPSQACKLGPEEIIKGFRIFRDMSHSILHGSTSTVKSIPAGSLTVGSTRRSSWCSVPGLGD